MAWFAAQDLQSTGVDRAPEALQAARAFGTVLLADIENAAWPLTDRGQVRQFDVVVVTNYLWRPLFPTLLQSVKAGGLLLYETYAVGNETVGKPARAEFLLRPGELLTLCQGLRIVAFEDGFEDAPARFVQRIAAVVPLAAADAAARYPLDGR